MIDRLLLVGATGDLAGRFLLPALASLAAAGGLPGGFRLVGAADQDRDDAGFAAHVGARLAEHAGNVPADARRALAEAVRYRRVDLADPASLAAAVHALDGAEDAGSPPRPVAVYLALPPVLFPVAVRALGAAGLPAGSRIAVEKPFGRDLAGAKSLNALLTEATGGVPAAAFRVDHFLGMPSVQALTGLRSPGGALAPLEAGGLVAGVDVVWEEVLDVAGRAGFYDGTGAVRDVLQNHLVQVLTLLAMELPGTATEEELHRARLALLRAVRVPGPAEVRRCTRRARYTAGTAAGTGGLPVRGYADEDDVDPACGTETFAEVALEVDTPRWAGTRFVLRTGKALAADRKRVVVHLRSATRVDCPPGVEQVAGDRLEIALDGVGASGPGAAGQAPGEHSAYAAVLSDLLTGSSRTAVSAEEAEQAWRFVDPVLQVWADGGVPLLEYPAGSAGPAPLD